MNKYKKLILALATLLSSTGVWAMGPKPTAQQINTYDKFGLFANKYAPSDFLANKDGILEVLLNAYNNLPPRAKLLAGNLIQSRFRLSAGQLSDKLAALEKGKFIPVTLRQAQEVIRSIATEKSALNEDIAKLNAEIAGIKSGIASFKGDLNDLLNLQKNYDGALVYADALRDSINDMELSRDQLQGELNALNAAGATTTQSAAVQKALDDANAQLAAAQAKVNQQDADLKQLEDKIVRLEGALGESGKTTFITDSYGALNKTITASYNSLRPIKEIIGYDDRATIKALTDSNKLEALLEKAEANMQDLARTADEYNVRKLTLDAEWDRLGVADQSQKQPKDDEIDANLKKFANRINEIRELGQTAFDTLDDLTAATAGAKAIVAKVTDLDNQIAEFNAKLDKEPIYKSGTLGDVNNLSTQIQSATERSEIGALEAASDKLKDIAKAITAENDRLKNEFAGAYSDIDARIKADNISAADLAELTKWYQAIEGYAQGTRPVFPPLANSLIDLIDAKVEELNRKPVDEPTEAEKKLDAEIDVFFNKLPTLDSVEKDLAKENAIKPGDIEPKDLAEALDNSNKLIKKYTPNLEDDAKIFDSVKAYPNLLKKLNSNKTLEAINGIMTLARVNAADLQEEINKKGTGNQPANDTVSGVAVSKTELRFKVGNDQFVIEDEPSILNTFIANVVSLSPETLNKVGQAIVAEVDKIADATERRQMLAKLFATIIYAPYDEAEQAGNKDKAIASIKELVKPIFNAYPEPDANIFANNLKKYGLTKAELKVN